MLLDAADELPAHQRVQLGVLVDRPVDGEQQPLLLECLEMLMEIGIAALGVGHDFVSVLVTETEKAGER